MSKLKIFGIVAGVLVVAVVGLVVYLNYFTTDAPTDTPPIHSTEIEGVELPQVNSFDDCVAVTNLVYTSNPSKCIAPNGKVFVNPGFERVKVITEVEKVK